MYIYFECGKFRRSRAIVSLVSLVPSCHGAFVGISWVQFCLFVGISWVRFFFFGGYFVGPKFFLPSILWVRNFLSCVFSGFNFFSGSSFCDSKIFSCWLHEQETKTEIQKYISNHVLFSKSN